MLKPELGMWYLTGPPKLAGDPEREAVLEFLAAAAARGYLPAAEHERRAELALAAPHCGVLGPLVADLPYSIELPRPPAVVTDGRSRWQRAVDAAPWLEEAMPIAGAVAAWLVIAIGVTSLLFWIASMTAT